MTFNVRLKTNRRPSGYANAKVSRYFNASLGRPRYAFQFYNVCKYFDHHKELRQFILDNYDVDIGDRHQFWGI